MDSGLNWSLRAIESGFYLLVTFYVFGHLTERSEIITASLLGILYASMRSTALGQKMVQTHLLVEFRRDIEQIKSATVTGYVMDNDKIKSMRREVRRNQIGMMIELGGFLLLSAICLWQLFNTL